MLIDDERAADVDPEHLVENRKIDARQRCEVRAGSGMHDDIDTTGQSLDLIEQPGHRLLVGHVCGHGDRRATSRDDLLDNLVRSQSVAYEVDDHSVSVGTQSSSDRPYNSARPPVTTATR